MKYAELLDKIDMNILAAPHKEPWEIILAVATLHTDVRTSGGANVGLNKRCTECGFKSPCPTIEAIENGLK